MNYAANVQALAEADFSEVADSFANAGYQVRLPAKGILQIALPTPASRRLRLLLSVGVHGDETAPIEMLAHLLHALSAEPHALQADLMVVVGNLAAIAQGKRYLEVDLNRLFTSERGVLQAAAEAERADAIMRATAAFFGGDGGGEKWHLDLHTAIRKSHYPTFAIVPDVIANTAKRNLVAWLGGAGIGAIILNAKLAPTYSAYTATQFGVASCTAELGQIGVLGANDLSQFAITSAALDTMLRSGGTLAFRKVMPQVFQVAQEIVKRSEDFRLNFDRATQNFTAFEPGTLIATDGACRYSVGAATEYVVFPNPDVRVGQRAGLMVVRRNREI
ncbi:MAG: succinylglutamate desuccinylase [Burkholderiaceae bacterium]|nr:succinylglutamate desuccinylase [Burkholderiaceae bacterium]